MEALKKGFMWFLSAAVGSVIADFVEPIVQPYVGENVMIKNSLHYGILFGSAAGAEKALVG